MAPDGTVPCGAGRILREPAKPWIAASQIVTSVSRCLEEGPAFAGRRHHVNMHQPLPISPKHPMSPASASEVACKLRQAQTQGNRGAASASSPFTLWLLRLHCLPLIAGLLAVLVVASCRQSDQVLVLKGSTMGTHWTVRLATPPPGKDEPSLRAGIEAVLEMVNAQMSTWREDSLLSRFNRLSAGESLQLDDDLALVLRSALALAEESGGAYDPTVGPLVNLWGFGPDAYRDAPPAADEIAEALSRIGWRRLGWDRHAPVLVQPGGLYIDLSSIAKGHAVDRVLEHLLAQGAEGVLVDIGGDTRAKGHKPDGSAWRIAVERATSGARAAQLVIEPGDRAVATSGTYRNQFESQGRRYSHAIDPRTGYPVDHDLVSITVLHDSCLQADALATALGVLGAEEGYRFAVDRDLAALFLREQDGRIVELMTPAFRHLIEASTATR